MTLFGNNTVEDVMSYDKFFRVGPNPIQLVSLWRRGICMQACIQRQCCVNMKMASTSSLLPSGLFTCQKKSLSFPMYMLTIFSSPHNWDDSSIGVLGSGMLVPPNAEKLDTSQRRILAANNGTTSGKVPWEIWRRCYKHTWRSEEPRHVHKRKP